jgi:hypothetical protein
VRFVVLLIVLLVAGAAAAMLWQHARYTQARREWVQDRQPLLHSAGVFHVVTFLELAPEAELFESVRRLRAALEGGGDALLVYAGKVAVNAQPSKQLVAAFGEEVPWDAVVLTQFASREVWNRTSTSPGYRRALTSFGRTYSHGMERFVWQSLLIPQILLARRIGQIVTRAPSHYPFEPAPESERVMRDDGRFAGLARERELGAHAVLVVNLILPGTAEEVEADRGYVRRMFGLMAEGAHGPLHVGNAVTLERGTEFERVALVYYPGVDYFRDMVMSRFYQGIFGGKQLGDTQASITVPILDRL